MKSKWFALCSVLALISLVLSACGGATATPAATEAPATEAPATEAPATEAPATEAPAPAIVRNRRRETISIEWMS